MTFYNQLIVSLVFLQKDGTNSAIQELQGILVRIALFIFILFIIDIINIITYIWF